MNGKKEIDCGCSRGYPERSWVQFLILRVLYEKPSYGYKVVKLIKDLSEGRHQIKYGTAYTLLRRMEKNNLLISKWEKNKGAPDKRIYRVTRQGARLLKTWLEMIIERKKIMDKVISIYEKYFRDKKIK
ncbi:MAG: PadR family transcriptional regulator [bacterium]|nr:PadR family transcriptional regulator [bacterium]